jgi:hypothetical protein
VNTKPTLTAVPDADLPLYPIGSDERLNNWFFRFESGRWLNSEMYLTADPEVGFAYLNLIFISQDQTPKGTLPTDKVILARLLRIPSEQFAALCRRTPSPLTHWTPCETDRGEVRLMHRVVTETLLEQIHDRERREAATSADGTRKRLDRLRASMQAARFPKAAVDDDVLVKRLDQWLSENHKGNRTAQAYDRAFSHAMRSKWLANIGGNPLS